MTWADAGINKLDIVGPRGLDHMLASMRLYTVRCVRTLSPNAEITN